VPWEAAAAAAEAEEARTELTADAMNPSPGMELLAESQDLQVAHEGRRTWLRGERGWRGRERARLRAYHLEVQPEVS
jgi:hypothetical protein